MNALGQRQFLGLGLVVLGAALVWLLGEVQTPPVLALLVLATGGAGVLVATGGGARDDDLRSVRDALRRMRDGKRAEPPGEARAALRAVFDEIGDLRESLTDLRDREVEQGREAARLLKVATREREEREARLKGTSQELAEIIRHLTEGVAAQMNASDEAARSVEEIAGSLREVARSVEVLAESAEESSSSILEMTATTEEVAENIGELGSNVRETVASIEEMAFSIKEVAKNVDALSLTAEETSSSMNEMDVSIDQVQTNANETARLSEEVAQDAERGAESILKTIGEIYRIKESTQEAVAVISNLGSRIDAIGQILNVIDEVSEQTNLLALNAAIIAAQAGEHGKGFAVVADEIKDLAERAGVSTKEIAELIKTIQTESRNAILAVERGAQNVDRGVEVSNEAERALKKILESSQKSTNMVRAIARATVEQAKGSRQVTDAIGRIAETVQQIAAATAQQARGSELIMRSGEKMRAVSQQVERSSAEQARGGKQITVAIESINGMVSQLNASHRSHAHGTEQASAAAKRLEEGAQRLDRLLRDLVSAAERMRRASN